MLIYRLEHLNGAGPYHCEDMKFKISMEKWIELDELSQELCNTHTNSPKHPIPNWGFTIDRSCGCESFDKLCEWFDGFLERFAKFGYVISVYESTDVKLDFNQVAFSKKNSELVERIKIL